MRRPSRSKSFAPVLAATILGAILVAPAASASTTTIVDCTAPEPGLQAALDNSMPGDTIVIDGDCQGTYTITVRDLTITGDPADGSDAVLSGGTGRVFTGTDVGAVTIDSLFLGEGYVNESVGGGAILLQGDVAPTIRNSHFSQNSAIGIPIQQPNPNPMDPNSYTPQDGPSSGGAISILAAEDSGQVTLENNAFIGNTATSEGGAVSIWADEVVMLTNYFQSNTSSRGAGGGAWLTTDRVTLDGNTFDFNEAEQGGAATLHISEHALVTDNRFSQNTAGGEYAGRGGGLLIDGAEGPGLWPTVEQSGNLFEGNSASPGYCGSPGCSPQPGSGAGEWVARVDVTSQNDRFVNNHIEGAGGKGGGIFAGVDNDHVFRAFNLILDSNSVAANGEGAGIAATGGCGGGCRDLLRIVSSTIVNNRGGQGSRAAGVAAPTGLLVTVTNSIVHGNGSNELEYFASSNLAFSPTVVVRYSDVCTSNAVDPWFGEGNVCADPQLAEGQWQTETSPTIDAGSNQALPATLLTDFEGEHRVADGNLDGTAITDMGADEFGSDPAPEPVPGETDQGGEGSGPSDQSRPDISNDEAEEPTEEPAPDQQPAPEECYGYQDAICGTDGDDDLTGTDGDDLIVLGPGNDIARGLGGNDEIIGGCGNDSLFGGAGQDELHGGCGQDFIKGHGGDDLLWGNDDRDGLDGGAGNDVMRGGRGFDRGRGGRGADQAFSVEGAL